MAACRSSNETSPETEANRLTASSGGAGAPPSVSQQHGGAKPNSSTGDLSNSAGSSRPHTAGAGSNALLAADSPSASSSTPPATSGSAVAAQAPTASASPPPDPLGHTMLRRSPLDWSGGPLYFTGSFDGSQRFSMWLDTMRFARQLRREHGRRVSYTYFVNACYYDKSVRGSKIGRAYSDDEVLVRLALTQQAINEGHEIGNHGVRHDDGGGWDYARWSKEFDEFHRILDKRLFRPVTSEDGGWVFPRFEPLAGAAARQLGARCQQDSDCDSGQCLELSASAKLCTQPCNARKPCPAGTACGTPNFQQDTDQCVVLPRFPIEHDGQELFDAEGRPNRDHPALKPYRIRGFRAPFLSFTEGTIRTLLERRYVYDASQVTLPGQPLMMKLPDVKGILVGFSLMQQPGARTIPMDYNYLKVDVTGALMLDDYKRSLRAAYRHTRRPPWSVGHHFSQWHDGAYWRAMQQAMRYAARGCPEADGKACPKVRMASFRTVFKAMRRLARQQRKKRPPPPTPEPTAAPDG